MGRAAILTGLCVSFFFAEVLSSRYGTFTSIFTARGGRRVSSTGCFMICYASSDLLALKNSEMDPMLKAGTKLRSSGCGR